MGLPIIGDILPIGNRGDRDYDLDRHDHNDYEGKGWDKDRGHKADDKSWGKKH
jgi:hypothetical protein